MAYSIFSRTFSQFELKMLGCAALNIVCFTMMLNLCSIFKQPFLSLELSMALGLKMLIGSEKINDPQQTYSRAQILQPIYNISNSRSDVFEINGDIRIHGNSSTIFIASSNEKNPHTWTIKPYPRKADIFVMQYVRKWKIKIKHQTSGNFPKCPRNFSNIPAVLFSTGGYTGNQFHDFTDLIIPLYLTSRLFNGTVLFLVTDKRYSWTSRYKAILNTLSKYDVVNIDKENASLCFTRMIIGLKSHKEFGINPQESPHYSMKDFRQFLRNTYSLDRESVIIRNHEIRPRMLIISRKTTRLLKNEREVAYLGRSLGFDVAVKEIDSDIYLAARLVNSFDVMVGVHGAGLTNMIFLPDKAVVIEIVPFGLETLAKPYFQIPGKEMELKYLKYKVDMKESSLLGQYPPDSEVYRNPGGIQKKGFLGFRSIYLDNQDVKIDCTRFRETLLKALDIVRN